MRHANFNWNLPEPTPSTDGSWKHYSWESINAALLMDLRDELQRLNQLLQCPAFVGIPERLREIARNTTPKKRSKKVTKK
jgi:hypothetical protein